MEITDVTTETLRVPIGRDVGDSRLTISDVNWVVVEIETDAGYTGTGWMGSLGFGPDLLERFVESQFVDLLVGEDPFSTEAIREKLRLQTIYYGEVGMSAWPRSAIDVALWDIKAKAAGQPLYRLLGGDQRRVPVYASSMDSQHDVDELAALHGGYADEGFTAFKTKVGNLPLEEEVERVRTIREAIGPDADLFVDANQAWTVSEAIEHVNALDEYDVGWVEEPISEFDLAGHRRVADSTAPPLATGEMAYRPEQYETLFEYGEIEVVQPDLIRAGGVTGQYEIAKLGHRHNVPFASHFYYAVSAHIVSAAPNGWVAEYIPEYDITPLLAEPPEIEDGHVILPNRPGHGYRIDPDAYEEYVVTFD